MKTLTFKTNIKCSGCIARVTPALNNTEGIDNWSVNILTPDKILTVETETLEAPDIVAAVEKAGFTANPQ
jgi:copper chaperone